MKGTWEVDDYVHAVVVRPYGDIIEHTVTLECTCVPALENIVTTCFHDGPKMQVRKMIVHNAMDGRE